MTFLLTTREALVDGRIVDQGGRELADKLEAEGYEAYVKAATVNA